MNNMEIKKLQDLIFLADINFQVYLKIDQKISLQTKNNTNNKLLILIANNSFNSAVTILHTLLCSTKKEELRIKPVLIELIKKNEKAKIINIDLKKEKSEKFFKIIENYYPNINQNYSSDEYVFLLEKDKRLVGDILFDVKKIIRGQSGLKKLREIKKLFEDSNFHKIRHQTVAHKNKKLKEPSGSVKSLIKPEYVKNLGEIVRQLRINSYFWFNYEFRNPYLDLLNDLDNFFLSSRLDR